MGFDFMNMMGKVQEMQKRAQAAQKELAELEITGESANGQIKVVCDGQGKFKSIKIDPAVMSTDTETLEDLISIAMTQANDKATEAMSKKMSQITGGIKIPGLSL